MDFKNESFVFHAEYIEDLPESYKNKYLWSCYNYGIFGKEPEGFSDLEQSLWIKIKRRMDLDKESYTKEKTKRSLISAKNHYKNGRATEAEISLLKANDIDLNNLGMFQNVPNGSKKFQNVPPNTRSVSVSDIDTVSDTVIESVYVSDIVSENLSLPQKNYGEKIFAIWNDAGLPCCKSNMINFLKRDFNNALESLKGYNSGEVIEAAKNYVHEFKSSDSFVDQSISFDSFVASKFFNKCLPDNYQHSNFVKFADKKLQDSIPDYDKPRPGKKTFFRDALEELNKGELKI